MSNVSALNAALAYATVREQRHAIETAIRVLNELGSQASKAQIKGNDQLMALRNMLDEKDSQLFEREQDLHFIISRLD